MDGNKEINFLNPNAAPLGNGAGVNPVPVPVVGSVPNIATTPTAPAPVVPIQNSSSTPAVAHPTTTISPVGPAPITPVHVNQSPVPSPVTPTPVSTTQPGMTISHTPVASQPLNVGTTQPQPQTPPAVHVEPPKPVHVEPSAQAHIEPATSLPVQPVTQPTPQPISAPHVEPAHPPVQPVQVNQVEQPKPANVSFMSHSIASTPTSPGLGNIYNPNIQPTNAMPNATVNPSAFGGHNNQPPQFNQMPQQHTGGLQAAPAPQFRTAAQYPGLGNKPPKPPKKGMPWLIFLFVIILVVLGTGYYVLFLRTGASFSLENLQITIRDQIANLTGKAPQPEVVKLPEFKDTEEGQQAQQNTPAVENDPTIDQLTPGGSQQEITTDLDQTDLNKMDIISQEIN